jgi:hypothetical protein
VRGLKRARNRPPLPWRWWEYGSERPDSSENHQAVLKTPTRSAEPPHTANGAGHTASRDASNRPQHARIAGVARGEARSAATGRGGGQRAEPHATPFFPSRALGPMLSRSARELWPFCPRFRAIPASNGAGGEFAPPAFTQNSSRSLQNCTFLCLEYTEVYVQTFPGARGWDRRFR